MIRKFVQCKNTKERMEMLAATGIKDWAEGELNTVMEIFGMNIPEGATKEDKWDLIMMSLKTKEAADIASNEEVASKQAGNDSQSLDKDEITMEDFDEADNLGQDIENTR